MKSWAVRSKEWPGATAFPARGALLILWLFLTSIVSALFLETKRDIVNKSTTQTFNDIYKYHLRENLRLFWQVDYKSEVVSFEVHVDNTSDVFWVAVGFSDRGDLIQSDMCVLWVDWQRQFWLQNAFIDEEGRFKLYDSEECKKFRYHRVNGITKYTFTRNFDTCSSGHYVLETGTTHIVWSMASGPLYTLEGVLAEGDANGMARIQILKPEISHADMSGSQIQEVTVKNVMVPPDETTYWCRVVELSDIFIEKQHIIEFGPTIEEGNEDIVHHMELFHCELSPDVKVPLYEGPCHGDSRPPLIDNCKRVQAAWAMGADSFVYPEEAGLPIGGADFNPFVMLEVHYNNPKLFRGKVDSSGIYIRYTSKLRDHDAGVMELGLEYTSKMAIPPGMDSFILSGYCIAECTALGLPPEGIHIFGSQLHTHLTGVRTWTKHYRKGRELPEVNRDNHYSTHFQEIRRLSSPVAVAPGDVLIMECEHSTTHRPNITLGGFSISDEMCVNYIHYYPKSELEVCKSSIDTKTLQNYFDFMNRMELQPTVARSANWRKNYESIEWNPLRALFLKELYSNSPLSMQCNRSNGERFPGYWEERKLPLRLFNLPTATSTCSQEEDEHQIP